MASKLTTQDFFTPNNGIDPTTGGTIPLVAHPTGIVNDLVGNGIELEYQDTFKKADGTDYLDRAGNPIPEVDSDDNEVLTPKTPEQLEQEALSLAQVAFSAIALEDALLSRAPHPYSPSNEEVELAKIEQSREEQRRREELELLNTVATDPDPRKRALAHGAYNSAKDADSRAEYLQLSAKIDTLEKKPNKTKWERTVLHALKKDREKLAATPESRLGKGKRVLQEHPKNLREKVERHQRNRTFKAQRKMGRKLKIDEEEIARTFAGRGSGAQTRYLEKLNKAEQKELRNQFGCRGTILQNSETGERFYVYDVLSTPAQALRITSYEDTHDPVTGEVVDKPVYSLVSMYLPAKDSKGNIIYKDNGTVQVEEHPLPRQDNYLSGKHKDGRTHEQLEILYYQDGNPIPHDCWDASSFDPADDIVVLKPLLTGEQVIKWLLDGEGRPIDDKHTTIKGLEQSILNGNLTILEDPDTGLRGKIKNRKRPPQISRTEVLQDHFIFKKEDETTKPDVRPPKDRVEHTGHFSRPTYSDPNGLSTREYTILRALNKYARARQDEATKKARKAREQMFR